MLKDRRFFITLQGRNSRWRILKEGFPQESVMAPIIFNVYTNYQLTREETQHFAYGDDLAVMAHGHNQEMVENKLEKMFETPRNHLKPNPSKTQVCAFNNCKKQANRNRSKMARRISQTLRHTDILIRDIR